MSSGDRVKDYKFSITVSYTHDNPYVKLSRLSKSLAPAHTLRTGTRHFSGVITLQYQVEIQPRSLQIVLSWAHYNLHL